MDGSLDCTGEAKEEREGSVAPLELLKSSSIMVLCYVLIIKIEVLFTLCINVQNVVNEWLQVNDKIYLIYY